MQLRNKRRGRDLAFRVALEAAFGPKFGLVNLCFGKKDKTLIGKINNNLSLTFE